MFKEFILKIEMAVYKHRMKRYDAEASDDFDRGRFKILTPQNVIAEESGHKADLDNRQLTDVEKSERYEKVYVDGDSAYSGSGM